MLACLGQDALGNSEQQKLQALGLQTVIVVVVVVVVLVVVVVVVVVAAVAVVVAAWIQAVRVWMRFFGSKALLLSHHLLHSGRQCAGKRGSVSSLADVVHWSVGQKQQQQQRRQRRQLGDAKCWRIARLLDGRQLAESKCESQSARSL